MSQAIKKRMKEIRELKGMGQKKIAAEMNISQQAYGFFESSSGSPSFRKIEKFCEITGIEPSFLMEVGIPITEESLQLFGGGFTELAKQVTSP